jgi:hypothetical protein
VSDAIVRTFIRRRNAAARRTFSLTLILFAALSAFVLSSQKMSPLQSKLMALMFGSFAFISILLLANSWRSIRYKNGPLIARRALLGTLAQTGGMIYLGAIFIFIGTTFGNIYSYVMYFLGAVMVALSFLRAPEIFDARTVLIVDAHGFFDRRFLVRPIAWEQLPHLIPSRSTSNWPVFRIASDPENSTFMRRMYARLGYPFLYVSFGVLDYGGADILLAIDKYAPELTSHLA